MAPISIRIGVPQVVKKQSEKSIHTHTTWPYWCQFHKPLAISRMKSNMINWHNFRKENAKKKLHANFSYLYINIFNYKTWQRWGHLQLNITKSTTLDINASIHSATKLYPSFIHSFIHRNVQNAMIPCRSQELLPATSCQSQQLSMIVSHCKSPASTVMEHSNSCQDRTNTSCGSGSWWKILMLLWNK